MRIIDITHPLGPDTPRYPGDPPLLVERLADADGRASFALSRLTLGSHAGTHVDPPAHLLLGGATVDTLPLDALVGPAWLMDLRHGRPITVDDLAAVPRRAHRLLVRTGGEPLTVAAADALARRRLRLVGVDGLSVDPVAAPGPAHRALLAAGVVVVEGLLLDNVEPGAYTLVCLPLRLVDGDGAPARAVLLDHRPRARRGG